MNNKTKLIIVLVLIAGAFAAGRYSTPRTETTSKESETVKKDIVTIVKEITRPDGTKETNTTIVDRSKEKKEESRKEVIVPKRAVISVSALVGYSIRDSAPVYGLSVSKEVMGPITIGAFGLNNGTIGVTIGSNF
jgi:hypothetical protein